MDESSSKNMYDAIVLVSPNTSFLANGISADPEHTAHEEDQGNH